jgi:hypothetical protein
MAEVAVINPIKHIHIRIEGVSPLLINRFTDAAQLSATNGTGNAAVGETLTAQEDAEQRLYISEQTKKVVMPQPNLFRCIIDAGKYFKNGKSKVTTQKSSIIPACLDIDPIEIEIKHDKPWGVDSRAIRIPSTGGRILRHRPCFYQWSLEFEATLDGEIMGEKLFRQIVDAAGKRVGLGDFRPDCKGPFGKFVVVLWELYDVD